MQHCSANNHSTRILQCRYKATVPTHGKYYIGNVAHTILYCKVDFCTLNRAEQKEQKPQPAPTVLSWQSYWSRTTFFYYGWMCTKKCEELLERHKMKIIRSQITKTTLWTFIINLKFLIRSTLIGHEGK